MTPERERLFRGPGGEPASIEEVMAAIKDPEIKWVGDDHVGRFRVATIYDGFLGGLGEGPVCYETAIFTDGDATEVFYQYESREDAALGHKIAVACMEVAERHLAASDG